MNLSDLIKGDIKACEGRLSHLPWARFIDFKLEMSELRLTLLFNEQQDLEMLVRFLEKHIEEYRAAEEASRAADEKQCSHIMGSSNRRCQKSKGHVGDHLWQK